MRSASDALRRRGRGRLMWGATILLLIIAIVLAILELIPANYYLLLPGDARPVGSMISVQGYPRFPTRGRLLMTDVSLYKVNHLLEEVYGRLNSDAELQPAQSFSGGLSSNQYQQLNVQLMGDSIQQAKVAALEAARGYKPRFRDKGPIVVLVIPKTPASRVLKPGDIIRAVDGRPVRTFSDIAPLVRRHKIGDLIRLTILRRGKALHPNVRTIATTGGKPDPRGKTPLIGVSLQEDIVLSPLPIKITINAGSVGGPSAGLMFTLGIVERLERRDITHGCTVAGTGTIDFHGKVGAIGGAKQKIIAARGTGAKYFLVPNVPDNVQPAQANRGNVQVVPVSTLRQALQFLSTLPRCR